MPLKTRNVLSAPRFLVNRLHISRIVRQCDKSVDKGAQVNSALRTGFCTFNTDKFFNRSDFSALLSNFFTPLHSPDSGVTTSWDIPDFVWETLLTSSDLEHIVRSYLGEQARLDDIYLKTVSTGISSVSEGWHDDNVGFRLKLFIVFNTEGLPSPTLLIPQEEPNIYRFKIVRDTLRILFRIKDRSPKPGEIKITHKKNQALLFDTNVQHRGGFSEGDGVRHCLIVEFMDRNKADRIKDKSPCGPKQGRGKIEIKAGSKAVLNSRLIDHDILQNIGGEYFYG